MSPITCKRLSRHTCALSCNMLLIRMPVKCVRERTGVVLTIYMSAGSMLTCCYLCRESGMPSTDG